MNGQSAGGSASGKRGLWQWVLAGTTLAGIAIWGTAVVLMSDSPLQPYDDLKITEGPVPDASTNGYLYLKKKWEGLSPFDPPDSKVLFALISGNAILDPAFADRLRKGRENAGEEWRTALAMPEWRVPPQSSASADLSWMTPTVRLLQLEAMIALQGGDSRPAIRLQQELVLFIRRQLAGGVSFSDISSISFLQKDAADLGCRVLAFGNPDTGQLAAMDWLWREEPRLAEAWRSALRNEAVFFREALDLIRPDTTSKSRVWQGMKDPHGKVMFKKNRTLNRYHASIRRNLGITFRPFSTLRAAREAGVGLDPEDDYPLPGRWGWEANATGMKLLRSKGSFGNIVPSHYHFLFVPRAMQVRLAVHRWRQAHPGQWPATLTELAPDFLPEVPGDPWNGAPLLWDQAARTVYAVGPDWVPDPPDFDQKYQFWLTRAYKTPGLRMELP